MPGERLVDVHGVEKRLVVAGLELVRADEEPIRVLLECLRDLGGREPVQRSFVSRSFRPILEVSRKSDDCPVSGSCAPSGKYANGVEVLDRALRSPLVTTIARAWPSILCCADHLLVEVIDHDLSLQPDRVVVPLDIAPEFALRALLTSNSGSSSTVLASL